MSEATLPERTLRAAASTRLGLIAAAYAACVGALCAGLVWQRYPPASIIRSTYAVALRGAEVTWMFAREHGHFAVGLPVSELELPPVDYSWSRAYHPDAPYAGVYDHVLVLTGRSDPVRDPRASVFGDAITDAVALAHHGRFWLFRYAPSAR